MQYSQIWCTAPEFRDVMSEVKGTGQCAATHDSLLKTELIANRAAKITEMPTGSVPGDSVGPTQPAEAVRETFRLLLMPKDAVVR